MRRESLVIIAPEQQVFCARTPMYWPPCPGDPAHTLPILRTTTTNPRFCLAHQVAGDRLTKGERGSSGRATSPRWLEQESGSRIYRESIIAAHHVPYLPRNGCDLMPCPRHCSHTVQLSTTPSSSA